MKLTKEEFQRIEERSPLELFRQGIRAEATREKYTRTLKFIINTVLEEFFEGSFEERVSEFVLKSKEDPKYARDLLLNISSLVKKRTELPKDDPEYLNPSSVNNYFKPIKKLFDMNDIAFSWKRIYSTFPEIDNISDGRGWTRDEIQNMLKFSSGAIDRVIILIASSSGIRSGAFSELNWNDIFPIYKIENKLTDNPTESEVENAQVVCAMLRI